MKRLSSILFFGLFSIIGFAQESTTTNNKYFVSTNSGVRKTPFGFRIGFLEKNGGYIAARFGKGDVYNLDTFKSEEATLFSVTAGFMLPITTKKIFKIHTFWGVGYGQWFDQRSDDYTKVGYEFEGGLMFSYKRMILSVGGNLLAGDETSAKKDVTIGLGYRF